MKAKPFIKKTNPYGIMVEFPPAVNEYFNGWRAGLILICIFANCLLPIASSAQSRDVPFTLEDRDRIIQMQIKMDEHFEFMQKEMNTRFESHRNEMNTRFEAINTRFEAMNTRFESQQQQLNDLKNLFYWGFGILVTIMLFIFGFIIWDRKTTMEPVRERTQSLLQTLREYAKKQPELADILRSHGLL